MTSRISDVKCKSCKAPITDTRYINCEPCRIKKRRTPEQNRKRNLKRKRQTEIKPQDAKPDPEVAPRPCTKCSNYHTTPYKQCGACRTRSANNNRRRRNVFKNRGRCYNCGGPMNGDPHSECAACRESRQSNRGIRKRNKRIPTTTRCRGCSILIPHTRKWCAPCVGPNPSAFYRRQFRLRGKALRRCKECKLGVPQDGMQHCYTCLTKKNNRSARLREKWRRKGLCSKCGKQRNELPLLTCSVCRAKRKRAYKPVPISIAPPPVPMSVCTRCGGNTLRPNREPDELHCIICGHTVYLQPIAS